MNYSAQIMPIFLVHQLMVSACRQLCLNQLTWSYTGCHVIEVASNGYLLKIFGGWYPWVGIEPTASTAAAAERLGIPVLVNFSEALGNSIAADGKQADLIVGNNVFAHVPDINDFTEVSKPYSPGGTITLNFRING